MGFSKNPLLDPWNPRWLRPAILKIDMTTFFFCWGWSDLDKISQTGAEWHVNCGDMVKIESRCKIPIWRTFGRIPRHAIPEPPATLQGAATWWIQWHVIPEPRITLQGAVTWRNQCHDCATLQGVIIPSAILKIVFAIFYFYVFNAVWALTSGGFRIVSDTLVCRCRSIGNSES